MGMGKLGSTASRARDEGNGWIWRGRVSMAQTELLLFVLYRERQRTEKGRIEEKKEGRRRRTAREGLAWAKRHGHLFGHNHALTARWRRQGDDPIAENWTRGRGDGDFSSAAAMGWSWGLHGGATRTTERERAA